MERPSSHRLWGMSRTAPLPLPDFEPPLVLSASSAWHTNECNASARTGDAPDPGSAQWPRRSGTRARHLARPESRGAAGNRPHHTLRMQRKVVGEGRRAGVRRVGHRCRRQLEPVGRELGMGESPLRHLTPQHEARGFRAEELWIEGGAAAAGACGAGRKDRVPDAMCDRDWGRRPLEAAGTLAPSSRRVSG